MDQPLWQELGWWTVLPPMVAILLALITRQVFIALLSGILVAGFILQDFSLLPGLQKSLEICWQSGSDLSNFLVIAFTVLIGALILMLEKSGGVEGFIHWVEKQPFFNTPKRIKLIAWFTGVLIFIESNITVLVAGSLARPLFDKFKISRERLALIIDSTASPICLLIPLNAWGAYIIGLLGDQGVEEPLSLFLNTIVYNFYCWFAILAALFACLSTLSLWPLSKAEKRTLEGETLWPDAKPLLPTQDEIIHLKDGSSGKLANLVLPILTMIVGMGIAMLITGEGDIRQADGSLSVFLAVLSALLVSLGQQLFQKVEVRTLAKHFFQGAKNMLPMAGIIWLALSIGKATKLLGTGYFVAETATQHIQPIYLLPVIFLVSSTIAFATGTSWGTFAIMIPIAIPTALHLGAPLAPFVAAGLSGGIFGDHCSPISDTTIMSSMASATDHIDHVITQLPYALISGSLATLGYLLIASQWY